MIKIIYGPKGTGKTKIIIDEANSKMEGAKGHLIFVTNTKRYMYDLHRDIRFIDTSDYMIAGEDALCGFIKGVVAANNDNEYLLLTGQRGSRAKRSKRWRHSTICSTNCRRPTTSRSM